jgi:hypothetical protein
LSADHSIAEMRGSFRGPGSDRSTMSRTGMP